MNDYLIWLLAFVGGVITGYVVCLFATWFRAHEQEGELRALATEVGVLSDMGDSELPTEWVLFQLESLIARTER